MPIAGKVGVHVGFGISALLVMAGANDSAFAQNPNYQASYCRYDVDVRNLPNAHARLGRLAGVRYATCPFLEGQADPAHVYVVHRGSPGCNPAALQGLPVSKIQIITRDQNAADLSSCLPFRLGSPSQDISQGPVYLLEAPLLPFGLSPKGGPWGVAFRIVELAGLPVSRLEIMSIGGTEYACFEMMKGSKIDPLTYLRSSSARLPPFATEKLAPATSCHLVFKGMGVQP